MCAHIHDGGKIFAIAQKVHGLVAERGERCEPAQYADEDQRTRLGGEYAARVGQLREKADYQTSNQVDSQRAEWKDRALRPLLDIAAEQITKDRADESACAHQKNLSHALNFCKKRQHDRQHNDQRKDQHDDLIRGQAVRFLGLL